MLYQPLPNGEAVLVDYYCADWVDGDLPHSRRGKGPRPSVLLHRTPGGRVAPSGSRSAPPQGRRRRRIKGDRWVRVVDAQPRANRCSLMPPNQRMHQSGRGRRFLRAGTAGRRRVGSQTRRGPAGDARSLGRRSDTSFGGLNDHTSTTSASSVFFSRVLWPPSPAVTGPPTRLPPDPATPVSTVR